MRTVTIGDLVIGAGTPKVIIPMVGKNEAAILEKAQEVRDSVGDLVEWRIDHFDQVREPGAVAQLSQRVREIIQKPLLITFRTFKEGGELDISEDEYQAIYEDVIANGALELLDVELFIHGDRVERLVEHAHAKGIKVVMCNHDFHATPAQGEIVRRLTMMEEKGADIAKIAVMPQSPEDVLTLLGATAERYKEAEIPLITMSMGSLGMVSRLAGEAFGSAATFGALGQVSAPGQMDAALLSQVLKQLKV